MNLSSIVRDAAAGIAVMKNAYFMTGFDCTMAIAEQNLRDLKKYRRVLEDTDLGFLKSLHCSIRESF